MTQRNNSTTADGEVDIQAAAALVLQREAQRKTQAKDSARKRHIRRQKEQLAAIEQLRQSLEVIKRINVAVAVVVLLGLVFIDWTLSETQQDIAEIERKLSQTHDDLAEIEREVDDVTSSLQRPLETLLLGEKIDAKLPSLNEGNAEVQE